MGRGGGAQQNLANLAASLLATREGPRGGGGGATKSSKIAVIDLLTDGNGGRAVKVKRGRNVAFFADFAQKAARREGLSKIQQNCCF